MDKNPSPGTGDHKLICICYEKQQSNISIFKTFRKTLPKQTTLHTSPSGEDETTEKICIAMLLTALLGIPVRKVT